MFFLWYFLVADEKGACVPNAYPPETPLIISCVRIWQPFMEHKRAVEKIYFNIWSRLICPTNPQWAVGAVRHTQGTCKDGVAFLWGLLYSHYHGPYFYKTEDLEQSGILWVLIVLYKWSLIYTWSHIPCRTLAIPHAWFYGS